MTMEEKNTEKKIAGEKEAEEKNVVLEAELLPDDFSDEDTEQDDDFDSSEDILEQTDFIDEKDYLDVMNYANNSIALEENHEDNAVMVAPRHLPAVQDNLQLYLREVSKFPLLEPDEEVALARRVRDTGDSEAAFRIISSHLRLVVRVAMDFQRRWMQNVLDLIQEGNVG
ncbi:MAG: RNA polymerase subunit sigma-70, partial [Mailhella sp.]|nr:RNA polymerase subunit sigma-70 [Mailhella sp.]